MSPRLLTSISFTAIVSTLALGPSARAGEVVLHKVPAAAEQAKTNPAGAANQTIGFVSATVSSRLARTLYVSSATDMTAAAKMIDNQPATMFAFGTNDSSPTTIFDLGKATSLHRISATYTSRGGKVDFYVLSNLPGAGAGIPTTVDNSPMSLSMNDSELRSVGSVTDDGNGRASVKFPETTGRYVMVKWTPAQTSDNLIVAEVAAFGGSDDSDVVASNKTRKHSAVESDGKTMIDSKDMGDAKDMPGEGPQDAAAPAEGPGTTLPQPPPFVFIPELLPVSN